MNKIKVVSAKSFIVIFFMTFSASFVFSQTDFLISDGGTQYVQTGDKFYDAGGPTGNDGNTDYTITLCPNTPGEMVVVDFNYFSTTWYDLWSEEDPLFIYDGPTATGLDIGELKGNYSVKYNTGVTPHGMGVEAYAGNPLIGTPTMFGATNSSGCLTFVFDNDYSDQNPGWEANIITYPPMGTPGCNIAITADDDSVCTGDPVVLTASGAVVSAPVNNDFNGSTIGTGWAATASASFMNNACGVPGLDGSIYLWMQNAPGPRALETNSMDVSNGGAISFEYRQAINNGNSSPCECPDQGSGTFEGIYVQYSIDNGASWTTFKYIFPNGTEGSFGAEGGLTGCGNYVKRWTQMTYPIPTAAQSPNTKFRWLQAKVTSSGTDNWGLDNVIISIPSPNNTITIEDLSTSTIIATAVNSDAIANVNPTSTTTYRATVDDGTTSCFEDFTVYVADPIVVSCGTATATTLEFNWTASSGATSYDYSYSVNGGAATNGNTAATTYTVNSLTSGDNVQLTVTPVNGICTDPVSCTCSTGGCATPTADAGSTIVITCTNPSGALDGTGSSTGGTYTYAWSTGDGNIVSGANSMTPTVNQAGTYTLTVTNTAGGCTATDNVVVTENITPPTAGITNNTGTTILTCATTTINVTGTGGGTYAWSGGTTPGTSTNTFNSAGNYTVTVTAANGCTDTETINITQNTTPPTAGITNNTGTTILTCATTTINVTGTGGGTYSWSGGSSMGTANNTFTSSGNYTVTVTAANGCTGTEVINITQNTTPPTAGITNNTGTGVLTCATTTINVTGTGGGTYAWSGGTTPGTSTNTFNSAGLYTVTVTAANGCTDTETINITQNTTPPIAGITNNTGTTILTCATTTINVTGTGGGTYAWSGGSTPGTGSNIFTSSGNYTLTVTSSNGCTDTEVINITQNTSPPIAGITNNTGTTILTCATTSVSVTATGGGTYFWNGGSTPNAANNVFTSAGNYTVTVTSANGCTDTETINITQDVTPPNAGITNNTGTTVLTCNTTTINVTATGGGTYAWSGGVTPGNVTNTFNATGSYTVTVTSANGCTDTETINITQNIVSPNAVINNNTGTTILNCNTTQINVTATGGGTYAWSGGSSLATAVNSFNSPGNYTVTVTSSNGCTDSESINITQDITSPIAGITNNTGTSDLTCLTLSISGTATGGTSYAWSGGTSPSNASNSFTSPNNYTVTVTGNNGCTSTSSINITQSAVPPTAGITNLSGTTIIDCNTSSINVTSTGGLTYAWSGGSTPGTANNSFNSAGNYIVTVTAGNGCTDTETINITQNITAPTAGIVNNTGTSELTCNTLSISATATGGGTYLWSGGSSLATAANTFNSAGTYTVTVTGSNGCTDTEAINITQNITPPTAFIVNNTGTTEISCNTPNISLTGNGGGTYSWSGGSNTSSANNTISTAGNYTLTVTAANGCTDTESINISQNLTPPTAGITNNTGTTELTCTTTSIDVSATGVGSYLWNGGTSTTTSGNTFNTPGLYVVTVTGVNGCTDTESINITQNLVSPSAGITNVTGSTELNCNIVVINVTATGGGTYAWSGGSSPLTSPNTLNSVGNYTLTVTAANGCTDTETISITQNLTPPTAIITNNTGTTILTCATTSISVTASGGVSYSWSGGTSGNGTANSFNSVGNYTVTVTGSNGCTDTESILITEDVNAPLAIIANNTGVTELNCNTTSISLTASGGTQYSWNAGSSLNGANNSVDNPGTYTVTVSGANGCTDTESLVITQATPLSVILNSTDAQCGAQGGQITSTINGGSTPIDIQWSNTETTTSVSDLDPGTYYITVTDADNCTAVESATIDANGQINALITQQSMIGCNGGETGSLQASTSNGVLPASFSWNTGSSASTISNLGAGNYAVTIIDDWGCQGTASAQLVDPQAMQLTSIVNSVSCNGDTDGSIQLTIDGGNVPYDFLWNTSETTSNLIDLAPGSYTVTVTDAGGCTVSEIFTVEDPEKIEFNATTSDLSCFAANDGSVNMSAAGGTQPYTFSIYNGYSYSNGAEHTNLPAGEYSVSVSDNNSCTSEQDILILEPSELNVDYYASNPSCRGNDNGYIELLVTGGTAPYLYLWDTYSLDTSLISGLYEGSYNISVTDANGCERNINLINLTDIEIDCIQIPNAYTPNTDGINDTWIIQNIELFPEATISVFNRWGQQMFSGRGDGEPWDGQYNGKFVPSGSYVYTVNLFRNDKTYSGVVTVVY